MMAINYFKLDFKVIKGTLKYLIIVPLIFILMFSKDSPIMAMGYLFFLLIIAATTPFSIESNEKCEKMYYMLPSKISSMVLGRYLLLISLMIFVWTFDGIAMVYLYNKNLFNILEVGIICFSGMISTILCFCQYPLYYKYGMEKGKIMSMILYMVPAFIVFVMPTSLIKSGLSKNTLNRILTFTFENKIILLILGLVIVFAFGFASYLLSCSICKKKEL